MMKYKETYKAFIIEVSYKEKIRDLEVFDIGRNRKVTKARAWIHANKSFNRPEPVVFEAETVKEVKKLVRSFWENRK